MSKAFLLSTVLASTAFAVDNDCQPTPPAPCNQASCQPCYCLGPSQLIANAPVNPLTCNGDVMITVAGLYWNVAQDGMEYATVNNGIGSGAPIEQEYLTPKFEKSVGIKVGISYASVCDGWDIGAQVTSFNGKASSSDEVSFPVIEQPTGEGQFITVLWSAFNGGIEQSIGFLAASNVNTNWNGAIDWLDIELGREYWSSRYLSLRPFVGIRAARINQHFEILQRGGSWSNTPSIVTQPAFNDEVFIDNDFQGIGVRAGFDLDWNFGCGWSLYNELGASILYGRFTIDHVENVREAETPFSKSPVLDTDDNFRASRAIFDLSLGIQYATLICDCKYGILARLSWEQHLFFHQNQMWRVNRIGGQGLTPAPFRNNNGENVFLQRRGTLSTQGLTFTFKFTF